MNKIILLSMFLAVGNCAAKADPVASDDGEIEASLKKLSTFDMAYSQMVVDEGDELVALATNDTPKIHYLAKIRIEDRNQVELALAQGVLDPIFTFSLIARQMGEFENGQFAANNDPAKAETVAAKSETKISFLIAAQNAILIQQNKTFKAQNQQIIDLLTQIAAKK